MEKRPIDRLYWGGAIFVWLGSFIVYWLTVQRSIPFWDCGEFIAASAILGVPHPPGTPLFIMIGRLFAVLPIADDISFRINMISVISSAFTAMLAYMVTARMIRYFFTDANDFHNRLITVVGAVAGGFFVAFGATNWGNSVESEVYGIAMALSMLILLLSLKYYDERGSENSIKYMVLAMYLAMLGVGIHMTVFLVVPTCALVFMLNHDATRRDWLAVCLFIITELALIIMFSNNRGGVSMFYLLTAVFGMIVLILTYKRINWGRTIAIVAISSVMIGFSEFITVCLPIGTGLLLLFGYLAKTRGWQIDWRAGLAIIAVAVVGFSVHLYMPVRSSLHPRIDENMTSRSYKQFVYALDRKQYGQMSMTDRMFKRRGEWSNQLGRHAHMGFWSYFEEQFSADGWRFVPFLALGLIGLATAIRKRLEMGLPFLTLLLLTSVGLVLYMNFADGTKYDANTGDAYLEVRDRDYFFTPAFVVFGIAMGLGVAGLVSWVKSLVGKNEASQARVAYAGIILALLPTFTLADNWGENDRSNNTIAYSYAKNILDSCDKNAILFTFGDNDTFPVWALQEAYGYRTDVKVVNMSLLNTDWYVEQMKFTHHIPMSLTRDQIRHTVFMMQENQEFSRPAERFFDRSRNRNTYMIPNPWEGRIMSVANMIMEDIILENRWQSPVFFTSPPYAESPLGLRERIVQVGVVYRLDREPTSSLIDFDKSDKLFRETYTYAGYQNSDVYRDENATGIFLAMGVASTRLVDEFIQKGEHDRATQLIQYILKVYPEYWQAYLQMGEIYSASGDTAKITPLYQTLFDTLSAYVKVNPHNAYYRQDLGMIGIEIGKRTKDSLLIERSASELWRAFDENPNSAYAFRKLVTSLGQVGKFGDVQKAAERFAQYKVNLSDPVLNQILGRNPSSAPQPFEEM